MSTGSDESIKKPDKTVYTVQRRAPGDPHVYPTFENLRIPQATSLIASYEMVCENLIRFWIQLNPPLFNTIVDTGTVTLTYRFMRFENILKRKIYDSNTTDQRFRKGSIVWQHGVVVNHVRDAMIESGVVVSRDLLLGPRPEWLVGPEEDGKDEKKRTLSPESQRAVMDALAQTAEYYSHYMHHAMRDHARHSNDCMEPATPFYQEFNHASKLMTLLPMIWYRMDRPSLHELNALITSYLVQSAIQEYLDAFDDEPLATSPSEVFLCMDITCGYPPKPAAFYESLASRFPRELIFQLMFASFVPQLSGCCKC